MNGGIYYFNKNIFKHINNKYSSLENDIIYKLIHKKKIIGSICHGAQLLISANVIKGKKISGYYSIKDDIINAGAIYVDAPAVEDNNIISSPHYKFLGDWMKTIISKFI